MSAAATTQSFLEQLLEARLLIPSGVRGVYGFGGAFEEVIGRFDALLTRANAGAGAEVMRFPPVLSRTTYEATDHLETFPNLLGSVHGFFGDEREALQLAQKKAARESWTSELQPTEVMLAPAACYPLYAASAGTLPPEGRTVDLRGDVFRHEPSDDPARLQSFRQREFVRLGTPEQALRHRDEWLRRGEDLLRAVGLEVTSVIANDPFFGRGGRVMAATQREQALKYELVTPIAPDGPPSAVASSNHHLDHFGAPFGIRTATGETAHSACIGFGLERVAMALFRKHGLSTARWPADVRRVLEL